MTAYSRSDRRRDQTAGIQEILLKRDLGDELTSQEETILAYAYYAAGEQPVRMHVGSDTETSE
jgi:hypothetical protein